MDFNSNKTTGIGTCKHNCDFEEQVLSKSKVLLELNSHGAGNYSLYFYNDKKK